MKYSNIIILLFILNYNLIYNLCNSSQINFISSEDKVYSQHKEWKSLNHKNNFGLSSVDLIKFKSYPNQNQVQQFKLEIDSSLTSKDININIGSYDSTGLQSKIKLDFGGNQYLTGLTPWFVQVCGEKEINFNISCINKEETQPCSIVLLINSTSTMDLCKSKSNNNFKYFAIMNDWFDSLVKSGDVIYHILENLIPIGNNK